MTITQRLLCVAFIAITACGGTAGTATNLDEAPTTTTAPLTTTTTIPTTTTTTEATTTTVDEIAASGAHFLEIVAPSGCLIEQIIALEGSLRDEEGYFSSDDWAKIVEADLPLYAQLADADFEFIGSLAAYDWPEIVQEDIDALIEEGSTVASWTRRLADSHGFDEWIDWWANPPEFVAGAVVRAKLGVPSGSEVEDCLA